jgi:SAM-dependent methyltransferase
MKKFVHKIIQKLGYKLIRIKDLDNLSKVKNITKPTIFKGYISTEETVSAAQKMGLSVCDYVEKIWEQVGETQKVIDKIENYNCFTNAKSICEIGAGTGRYMEKVIRKIGSYEKYVSYETASDWAEWLEKEYNIIKRDTDGKSLKYEDDNSIDLVHAHGVFVYLSLINSFRYFKEMLRVTKKGGYIVFDLYTDEVFDLIALNKWLISEHEYPVIIPVELINGFFTNNNCQIIDKFKNKHGQSCSQYYIIKKNG